MSRADESHTPGTMTGVIPADFEGGVFQPREPVALPEGSEVEFELPLIEPESSRLHRQRVHALLSRSIATGERDMAERHDEPLS